MRWIKNFENFTQDTNAFTQTDTGRGADDAQFDHSNSPVIRQKAKEYVAKVLHSNDYKKIFNDLGKEVPKDLHSNEMDSMFDGGSISIKLFPDLDLEKLEDLSMYLDGRHDVEIFIDRSFYPETYNNWYFVKPGNGNKREFLISNDKIKQHIINSIKSHIGPELLREGAALVVSTNYKFNLLQVIKNTIKI